MSGTKNWWLSWYSTPDTGAYTLHWPWWVSGARIVADRYAFDEGREEPTICAAVQADSEEAAKEIILAAHDRRPANIEWRFCEERPADWSPFGSDRFPRDSWMHWPTTPDSE